MSCNRDNIFWQRADGTWVGGFYTFHESFDASSGEDFDHEWDVEYDDSSFWVVTRPHATYQAAYAEYCAVESNPGGSDVLEHRAGAKHAAEVAALETMYQAAVADGKLVRRPGPLLRW